MTEEEFTEEVADWCRKEVARLAKGSLKGARPERLVVKSDGRNTRVGTMPWPDDDYSQRWKWTSTTRQLDVVIGLDVEVDEHPATIPLVAIELKTGTGLNSDELDKKSAIYGPLRELYPWCKTILAVHEYGKRDWFFLLRNARQFDAVLAEWDEESCKVLQRLLEAHLLYTLAYWRF